MAYTLTVAKQRTRKANTQHRVLLSAMADGKWYSLERLNDVTGYGETSISAQLRNLRKIEFGGHVVLTRRLNGMWEYRIAA